jgi:hypothetical protein
MIMKELRLKQKCTDVSNYFLNVLITILALILFPLILLIEILEDYCKGKINGNGKD